MEVLVINSKDKVYEYISQQITEGNILPNERITEQSLAEATGLSRTPIREALLHLAALEIIEHTPNKGFKLVNYTLKDLEEVYQLIGILDGKSAQLAAPFLTEEDYSLMQFHIDTMYSAIANGLYIKYNEIQEAFHDIYINKAQNRRLIKEIHQQKQFLIAKAFSKSDPNNLKDILNKTNDEHQVILNLFKENNLCELRRYLEEVHWRIENARYDLW